MNTTPFTVYDVVEPEKAFDKYTSAIRTGELVEYDLVDKLNEVIHVLVDVETLDHDDQDEWRLTGRTTDFRTFTMVFRRKDGVHPVAVQAIIRSE